MQDESENGDIGTMKTEIHRMEVNLLFSSCSR